MCLIYTSAVMPASGISGYVPKALVQLSDSIQDTAGHADMQITPPLVCSIAQHVAAVPCRIYTKFSIHLSHIHRDQRPRSSPELFE